jgi:hypothetical protein
MASATAESNGETLSLNTRFATPIGTISKCCSARKDEIYYGSKFIIIWEQKFTEENGEITFDSIYKVLVNGLKKEGEIDPDDATNMDEVMRRLNAVAIKTAGKRNKQKMEILQQCCVEIYTMDSYVHLVVNRALRDDDWSKLSTVGPYCYILFNYIGRRHNDYSSIKRLFRRALRSTKGELITVYRGDVVTDKLIEEYRQAVENKSIYFKWKSFVSTSLDENVTKNFEGNVLYIIELDHHSAKDQCVDLTEISVHDEKEVLLRPGVRFKVTRVEPHQLSEQYVVHIKILPSYISQLQ